MPNGPPVDLDVLLAPLPGENPAGSSASYLELRSQLDDLRKEVNPDDFDKDDPARPDQPRYADWPKIEALTRKALINESKDLRLAGYLVESLVHQYQFAGCRLGMQLLRGLLDQCWDRSYPTIEDGDVEVRLGVFNALDDLNTRGRTPFPNLLRHLPVVEGGGLKHSYEDWKKSQERGGGELAESFAKALQAVSPERGAKTIQDVEACLEEHGQLVKAIETRFGRDGTSLPNLRRSLEDCGRVARLMLTRNGVAAEPNSTTERPAGAADSDMPVGHGAASRADAYRQLAQAAALLQRLEPHSPIPYLVQRAVELGSLPFPQLMKALIRDANVLAELNREFGLHSET